MKLRDKIFAAKDMQEEKVFISEWDTEVLVKSFNGTARNNILQACTEIKGQETKTDLGKMQLMVVIESTFDPETGEKVFEKADMDALGSKSAKALDRIFKVASRLSGLNNKDETEKNS